MLRFSMFGIPVGVHWSFAFIGVLAIGNNPFPLVVAFVVGVFIAVLAHEMGHALTARTFGAKQVKVTLFALGGLTQYPANTPMSSGRRFLIAASGSAVGMTLGGALFLVRNTQFARDLFDYGYMIGVGIVLAGLVWGALNWLPILPLDGGNMVRYALEAATPKYALRIAKVLTLVTAGVVAYLAVTVWDNTFGAVFLAVIALQGLQIPEHSAPARRARPDAADQTSLLSIFDDDKPSG
jgi:Zn-dependent protease